MLSLSDTLCGLIIRYTSMDLNTALECTVLGLPNLIIKWICVISRSLIGEGFYFSAEMQSVYSTVPVDKAAFLYELAFICSFVLICISVPIDISFIYTL